MDTDKESSLVKEEAVDSPEETPKAEPSEAELVAIELRDRLARAEARIEKMKLDRQVEKKVERFIEKKAGELDETHLAYLELKGVSEPDDIKVIERHVQRTGETVREALKDDYVMAKLASNKEKREGKAGTPSSTKRTGGAQTNDLSLAIARFEQTGELPQDFALASQVTNALVERSNPNKPRWR